MKIIALEYSYVDWSGKQRIVNYVPVDSMETGLYLAKEALACETSRDNTTVEHPLEYVWIITSHNELLGDQAYMIAVTEREALTMADVKAVVNSNTDPSNP